MYLGGSQTLSIRHSYQPPISTRGFEDRQRRCCYCSAPCVKPIPRKCLHRLRDPKRSLFFMPWED